MRQCQTGTSLSLAVDGRGYWALGREIAVYRRRGTQKPHVPFDEFVSKEWIYEELAELDGTECDEFQALKMLRIAASSDL